MRIAVPLPGTMWAFDVISIIQIFDDDSVMYGSPDRPVIDFIANGSSKALDHGMSIATTALRDYHEKPDLIIIPGFANPHEIATDRRTRDAKARLFTADPADALAIRDWLVASHREGVEIAACARACSRWHGPVCSTAWNAPRACRSSTIWPRSFPRRWCGRTVC